MSAIATMVDYTQIPENVRRLASVAFLQGFDCTMLQRLGREAAASFAAEAGLTVREYAAAMRWLGDFYMKHADELLAADHAHRH